MYFLFQLCIELKDDIKTKQTPAEFTITLPMSCRLR